MSDMKWISVKDRTPDGDTAVLCYVEEGTECGRRLHRSYTIAEAIDADGEGYSFCVDGEPVTGITAWMPLPDGPGAEEPKKVSRAAILRMAERMVCGHREEDYGSPEDSFQTIANLWTAYTDRLVTPKDVAMMMALLKIARIKGGRATMDSFVDLAGYAACGGEIEGGRHG